LETDGPGVLGVAGMSERSMAEMSACNMDDWERSSSNDVSGTEKADLNRGLALIGSGNVSRNLSYSEKEARTR
jgi:hypothetical protein